MSWLAALVPNRRRVIVVALLRRPGVVRPSMQLTLGRPARQVAGGPFLGDSKMVPRRSPRSWIDHRWNKEGGPVAPAQAAQGWEETRSSQGCRALCRVDAAGGA
jgi:hypothetical protein